MLPLQTNTKHMNSKNILRVVQEEHLCKSTLFDQSAFAKATADKKFHSLQLHLKTSINRLLFYFAAFSADNVINSQNEINFYTTHPGVFSFTRLAGIFWVRRDK